MNLGYLGDILRCEDQWTVVIGVLLVHTLTEKLTRQRATGLSTDDGVLMLTQQKILKDIAFERLHDAWVIALYLHPSMRRSLRQSWNKEFKKDKTLQEAWMTFWKEVEAKSCKNPRAARYVDYPAAIRGRDLDIFISYHNGPFEKCHAQAMEKSQKIDVVLLLQDLSIFFIVCITFLIAFGAITDMIIPGFIASIFRSETLKPTVAKYATYLLPFFSIMGLAFLVANRGNMRTGNLLGFPMAKVEVCNEMSTYENFCNRYRIDFRSNLFFLKTILFPLVSQQISALEMQIENVEAQIFGAREILESARFRRLDEKLKIELRGYQKAFLGRKERLLEDLARHRERLLESKSKIEESVKRVEKKISDYVYALEIATKFKTSGEAVTGNEEQAYLQSEQQERLSAELDDFIKTGEIHMDLEMDDLNKALAEELKF